ncbi:MAG: hypothetical protein A2138_27485 [Deltaproteobacteria bacterium RBG_16_71_12]|nr:MAG: hypothetical protein A2138_27485 [Deltaproteobacteria bacterium RBG_16_71_12]
MDLLELYVQGLKGATEPARLAFTQPVTMVAAGVREQLYVRIMLDLLYPKGTEPTLIDLDEAGQQSRVGLTVRGRDGTIFRLLQDVHTGRRALQRGVDGKAEPISNAAAEIAQAVTAQIGFPQEDILRELFFAVADDLPSRRARAPSAAPAKATTSATGKAERPLPPGFGGAVGGPGAAAAKPLPPGFSDEGAPVADPHDDAAMRRRLAEIDAALGAAQGVRDLEFEIDGLQKRLFDLDAKIKPLLTLRRSAQQAEEQGKRFADLDGVPGDLVEQGERLRRIRADHDRDLERMAGERDQLLESSKTLDRRGRQNPVAVAQKDRFVQAGVGVGVGAIVLGVVGALAFPPLRWLALLDIPAFGVALYGGLRVLGDLEGGASVARRLERLDAEKKRLEERFRIDEQHLTAMLKQHGYTLEQLPDLAERLTASDEARRLMEQTRGALAEAEKAGDVSTLEAQQHEAQTRLRSLEEQLQGQGGFGGPGDLEREKAEIEAALAAAAAPDQGGTPDPMPSAVETASSRGLQPAPDLGRRLLELARDVFLAPIEEIATSYAPRASQMLATLTDGRYREVRFLHNLKTHLVDGASGEELPFGFLPAADRDIAWLSIKLALIEGALKRARVPVVFDRSLDGLPDAKGPLLARMLAFLAGGTQVVCITAKTTIR